MNLHEIQHIIAKTIWRRSAKKHVREFEETPRGVFNAFVDDGVESFDVRIEINAGKEIINHQCDCGSKHFFCVHKAAVVSKILLATKSEKEKIKKVAPKRLTQKEIDPTDTGFKKWVLSHTQPQTANREKINFPFDAHTLYFQQPELINYTTKVVSIILNKNKIATKHHLKQMVAVWTKIHTPAIETYIENITRHDYSNCIACIADTCMDVHYGLRQHYNIIPAYVRWVLSQIAEPVALLGNDDLFEKTVSIYIAKIWRNGIMEQWHYFDFCEGLLEILSPHRREKLLRMLFEKAELMTSTQVVDHSLSKQKLLDVAVHFNLLAGYHHIFEVLTGMHEFNKKLISHLIVLKHYDTAERFCNLCILGNSRITQNTPYYELLHKIYSITKNETGLVRVSRLLLPLTFDYDDYVYVRHTITDKSELRKWRAAIIAKARRESLIPRPGNKAQEFIFRLMTAEGKTTNLISVIDSYTSFRLLIKYFTYFKAADANGFITQIFRIEDTEFGWHSKEPNADALREKLANLIIENYPSTMIQAMNNARTMFSTRSVLIDLILRKLHYRDSTINNER